jgi:hypothetical protein
MKTILVVYTFDKLTKKSVQGVKKYAFNVSFPVKVGDMFDSDDYSTPMQVVEVMKKTFKYVNTFSGDLSNKPFYSTKNFELRELVMSQSKNVVNVTRHENL